MIIVTVIVKLKKLLELFQNTIYSNHRYLITTSDQPMMVKKIGYNLYVSDIRYQKFFGSTHPIKVELKFDGVLPAGIYGYALVLTNKSISISSDRQRHFNLI